VGFNLWGSAKFLQLVEITKFTYKKDRGRLSYAYSSGTSCIVGYGSLKPNINSKLGPPLARYVTLVNNERLKMKYLPLRDRNKEGKFQLQRVAWWSR